MSLTVALLAAWLLGILLVALLWPRTRSLGVDGFLISSLGLGAGLAVSSTVFFLVSLVTVQPGVLAGWIEWILGLGLLGALIGRRRGLSFPASPVDTGGALTVALAVQATVVAAVVALRVNAAEPYGGWDGWAIWNLHARLILRGGEAWPAMLEAAPLAWSHLDYPWLVSASVARAWAMTGAETSAAPAWISVAFAWATVGTLVGALWSVGSRCLAGVAGAVLLGTPFFVTLGANQHADVPLGGFVLATVTLLALAHRWGAAARSLWALAGAMAGFAAWTKNEGLLFVVAIGALVAVGLFRIRDGRAAGAFFGTLGVTLLPLLYFKLSLAPRNDVLAGSLPAWSAAVFELERHRQILAAGWRDVRAFGEWRITPLVFMALTCVGRGPRRWVREDRLAVGAVGLVALGYYAVYLITPWNLQWHLDTSLVRLLLQLWPAVIFLWALVVPQAAALAPMSLASPGSKVRGRTLAWAGANVAVACALVASLGQQRAANELASFDRNAIAGSVVAGDGWFPGENDGRNTWRWSKGSSALVLHIAPEAVRDEVVQMQFGLRALGERTVTIRQAGVVLWSERVGASFRNVDLPAVRVRGGISTLDFSTDAPGVPESAAANARALTFALYDVRVR